MEKYELVPDGIRDIYSSTKKYIQNIKEKHRFKTDSLDYPYQDELMAKKKIKIAVFEEKCVSFKKELEEEKRIFDSYQSRLTSLECQLKRLCGQYDSNCLDMSRTNNENCCQDTTENYELVCQQLKNKELLLESAQNQMKNDTKCHLFDSQITTLEKQILDYTNKLEMISKLSGLQTEKEKLTKSISDLKIRVNSSEFIEKKKQLSTDLDTSSATGLIGVALVVKENYLTSKSKEFTGMKADEESLKKI